MIAQDLNSFLDRYDRNNATGSSFASKGHTPNKYEEKQKGVTMVVPSSNKKRSLSRNQTQKSLGEEDAMTNSFYLPKSAVEGNELFANIRLLGSERVDRQANEHAYIWRLDEIQDKQEKSVREDIERFIRIDFAQKLLSFDYKKLN